MTNSARDVHIGEGDAWFPRWTRSELHFHLLPGVDDGPATMEDALALAAAAVADGTGRVVCTPHVELVDVATLPDRVRELQDELRDEGIQLALSVGGEIRVGTPLTATELEILAHGPPDRRWLLLEAPLERGRLPDFHAHADELEARGYGLLIGHPERCPDALDRRSARLQVNASSLTGAHGVAARDTALRLLRAGAVEVLASDAHGPDRPPLLGDAVRRLAEHGIDGVPLVESRPRALLAQGIASSRTPAPERA